MFRIVLLILESADRGPGCCRLFGVASLVMHVIISSVYFSYILDNMFCIIFQFLGQQTMVQAVIVYLGHPVSCFYA